jgi:uncharacterized protein (TIGR00299 family) protein
MKTLFIDLFSGISGDMFLGAMLDLGVDFESLQRELSRLGVDGYHLHVERKTRTGIAGISFTVHLVHDDAHGHSHDHDDGHHHGHSHGPDHFHDHPHPHGGHEDSENRNFEQIRGLISKSPYSDWVKEKAVAVFRRVAVAEGRVHGLPPDQVHFHEVGAVDSIIDIVGACLALEQLGRPRVLASRVIDGSGFIQCAHGTLPVPAPATLEILAARGVPIEQCSEPHELVTPTGAALLAEFVEVFGPMPALLVEKTGYGLGQRENKTRPNVLRICLATPVQSAPTPFSHSHSALETDTVAVLETNLDDINPEVLGHFVERSLGAGALDVFFTPIQMKKSRPGMLLTVLCVEKDADRFSEMILRETSSFGVRRTVAERRKLEREFVTVETLFGKVTVKLGKLGGKVVQTAPEFESCKAAAESAGVPLKAVYEAALHGLGSN